jgi:Tol biopolymer transport system component
MKRIALVILAVALAARVPAAQDLERLFKAAVNTETVDRNYKAAIEQYKQVAAGDNRSLAAQALLRMAECYRLLGDPEAQNVYERLVLEFPEQKDPVARARDRLQPTKSELKLRTVEPRLLCDDCGGVGAVSRDGRWFVVSNISSGGDIYRRDLSRDVVVRMQAKSDSLPPAQGGSQTYWPIVSADSRQIAYAFNGGSLPPDPTVLHARLMVMPNRPGAPARVLINNPEIAFPVPIGWRGNDAILTLAMKPDRTWQLMTVDSKTGGFTVLKSLEWRVDELARAASVSPDGGYIAYSAWATNPPAPGGRVKGDARRIYVIAADGRSETTLTAGAGIYQHPVWTPDGRHVVYISDVSGTYDLWAIPVHEGRAAGQPKLLRKDIGDAVTLGMTDTGTYHYFSLRTGVHRASIMPIRLSSRGGAAAAASATIESFVGQAPRWSPDGKLMAVTRRRPGAAGVVDLVIRDLKAGTERVYRRDGLVEQRPIWFADGGSLLLLATEGQQRWWFRLDVESGHFTALVKHPQAQERSAALVRASAVLSPDGRTLYFVGFTSPIDRIVALDLQSGETRTQLTVPGDDTSLPFVTQGMAIALSPDGQTFAIAWYGKTPATARLARMDLDGGNFRELVPHFKNDFLTSTLAWSRDGQSIFFVDRARPAGDRLMRVSRDGGAPGFTGVQVVGLSNYDLSADGASVVYDTSRPDGAGHLHLTLDLRSLLAAR